MCYVGHVDEQDKTGIIISIKIFKITLLRKLQAVIYPNKTVTIVICIEFSL